jgi:HD-GYP domain-containing protein (c-di-GMP phosphodiesterase class II)
MTEEPLYSSRIINTYLELTKKYYPQVNISELLEYAGVEPYQTSDEGHWFTQSQHDRFHEKLVELTGNPDIAREAGRYTATSNGVGSFKQYTLALMGPVATFAMVGRLTSKFTRSSSYASKKISANTLEITVSPRQGVREKPYQCANRWGMFQAVFDFFHYKVVKTEHPECIFKGGKACRYVFSWEPPPSALWKKIRNITAGLLITAGALLVPYFPWDSLVVFIILSLFFLLTYFIDSLEKKELNNTINNFRKSAEEQVDQIDINYKNAMMINEIGQTINKKLNIHDILENIMQTFKARLDYDRGMILLVNPEKTSLTFSAGYGLDEEQLPRIKSTAFQMDKPSSHGTFFRCYHEQKPFLVGDTDEIKGQITGKSQEFLLSTGSKSFITCPIIYEKESLGLLVVDNIRKKRALTQTDISLLTGIANQIGISINNARLIDQQKKQFNSILRVLAASIDARDPLTAGHSEKVTEYALGIAREMGLGETFCEVISIAALLHDYGKIAIRDDILKKPGQLSSREYREIQSHALKTRLILDQMNFSDEYTEIPLMAGAHHERFDGNGYPNGLKGEEIPLGARIIAVADVFEALTSQRHYRDPMPTDEALKIIKEGAGTAFDLKVVEAFSEYYHKTFIRNKALVSIYETVSPRPLIQEQALTLH